MKLAHLITAYKNPLQLKMLVERLWHPDSDIYIHLDKKIAFGEFSFIATETEAIFISDRTTCNWGGFSFVVAITRSLKEILVLGKRYDYINLISGQDYPIKPINQFHDYLNSNSGKLFISFDQNSNSDWWQQAVTRYQLYHFTDYNIRGRYRAQAILNHILPKRKFPLQIELYGSAVSSWWTITDGCARYVLNFLENNPKLLNFMKLTWGADEFLFATTIMNSPFKEAVVNNNLRHIEWIEGMPNPKILRESDLPTLKSSPNFFARKFDIYKDFKILTMLDIHLSCSLQSSNASLEAGSSKANT